MEIITIGTKEKKENEIEYPIPYKKIPMYFRRAAINSAISLVRSYEEQYKRWQLNKDRYMKKPMHAKGFHASPIYYKGMYRNFKKTTIELKVWNGEKWIWILYSFHPLGRDLPEEANYQSPFLKITEQEARMHVPVVTEVFDTRNINQRIKDKEKICAVYFPNNKHLAVCVLFDRDNKIYDSSFIEGGTELKSKRKKLIANMNKEMKENVSLLKQEKEEKRKSMIARKYKSKIGNLNDNYAHNVSKKIIAICKSNHIKIIVVPKYKKTLPMNQIGYIKSTEYDWIGRKISAYVKYKAFRVGIVACSVAPHYCVSKCYKCEGDIKKYKEGYYPNKNFHGGNLFVCVNGHEGNVALNAAKNIGKTFIQQYCL